MAVAVGLQRACFVAGFEARLGAEVKWRADRFFRFGDAVFPEREVQREGRLRRKTRWRVWFGTG